MGQKEYSEGYWMSIGIGIGISIGISLGLMIGIAVDNIPVGIAIGPAIGAGLGSGIGSILEAKYKYKMRPLTDMEKASRRSALALGIAFLLAGILVFSYILLTR